MFDRTPGWVGSLGSGADAAAGGEVGLGLGGMLWLVGLINFQPQAFGALAAGD